MAMMDSIDKIVTRYFAVVTTEEFTYKGKTYLPKPLQLSSLLLRNYTCPPNCGACCPKFSLDYISGEEYPERGSPRDIKFNEKIIAVYSDMQSDHSNYHCRYLNKKDGRCKIHPARPFSCDFELIRPLLFTNPDRRNILTQRLFGRGWNMKRIDNNRGTLCEMTPITNHGINEVIRKIERLEQWCNEFNLQNKCSEIVKWIESVRPFTELKNFTNIQYKL